MTPPQPRTNLRPAPEAGPLHTPYQCCHKKCICSQLHNAFESLSSLATVVLHNLEQDTQHRGPIALDDETWPHAVEDGFAMERSQKKKLMFPRYWGLLRFWQAFVSLFTMIVFSVYLGRTWRARAPEIVILVLSILAMLYSAFLGYVRMLHRDWCPWLLTFAPLILLLDTVILSTQIVTFIVFPRIIQNDWGHYRRKGFDDIMWIPTVTANFLLYIWSTVFALYITCLLFHQENYFCHLESARETYQARKSKEKKARELVQRILDGSLDVVPVASRPEGRARGTNQTQSGYVAAAQSAVALVETGGSQSHTLFPAGPSHSQEVPTATTTFHVNHTSSRPSKFTLTSQEHDPRADSQRCCRMCGEHGLINPPDYIHTAVAALPQIPLVPRPANTEARDDGDDDDESTENTGLLKRPDSYQ